MPLFSRRSPRGAASDPFPSGSHGTGVQDTTAKLTLLRGVTGPEAREGDLLALLERHGGDVNAAINTYLDAGVHGAPQPPPGYAASSSAPAQALLQVTCPAGVRAGEEIQVSAPAGLMRVVVPQGVAPGQTFLMRCPGQTAQQQQQQQPSVVVVRQSPRCVVARPYGCYGGGYYGGCYRRGYYGDPYVGAGVGLLGGLLVANALFW